MRIVLLQCSAGGGLCDGFYSLYTVMIDRSESLGGSLAVVLVTLLGPHLADFLFHEIENSIAPMYCWRRVL
jgi:hypothetical protein